MNARLSFMFCGTSVLAPAKVSQEVSCHQQRKVGDDTSWKTSHSHHVFLSFLLIETQAVTESSASSFLSTHIGGRKRRCPAAEIAAGWLCLTFEVDTAREVLQCQVRHICPYAPDTRTSSPVETSGEHKKK